MDNSQTDYIQREAVDGTDFSLTLIAILLLTMGSTLLIFSLAYVRDLQTLYAVPDAIWDALCGRPDPDSLTLPLMLTFGLMSVIGAGGVWGWKWFRRRRSS